jgi:hypothetical protein
LIQIKAIAAAFRLFFIARWKDSWLRSFGAFFGWSSKDALGCEDPNIYRPGAPVVFFRPSLFFAPNRRARRELSMLDLSDRSSTMTIYTRRQFAAGLALLPALALPGRAQTALPTMTVAKDPSCSCCGSWVKYLRANGFAVDIVERTDMDRIKAALGVPAALQSCHTAEIDGYVIEGHVPADAIRRLLTERPQATGLAVAGMPSSAPGMDVPNASDIYEVTLFASSLQRRYARYLGLRLIAN